MVSMEMYLILIKHRFFKSMLSTFFYFFVFFLPDKLLCQAYSFGYQLVAHPYSERAKTIEEVYYLDTDSQSSVFRTKTQKKSDSLMSISGLGLGVPNNFEEQIYVTKKLEIPKVSMIFISPTSKDKFFVNNNEKLTWKIQPEITTFANYNCQKAETDYGGRKWSVLFTTDLPLNDGPYIFHGLPGLIVYAIDEKQDYEFSLFSIKKIEKIPFYYIGKKIISWDEFNKIKKEYFEDPFIFAKQKTIKIATDDGNGGVKAVNFREMTNVIRERIIEYSNPIELSKAIKYQPN